jgi:molecular chaperone GrpE
MGSKGNGDSRIEANQSVDPAREDQDEVKVDKSSGKKSMEDKIDSLQAEIERLTEASKENYDRFLRASAELDNYRKRASREMDDTRKYATQALLKDLLAVADNLDLAIKSSTENSHNESNLLDGIDLTRKELLKVFDKYNVKPIEALGSPFDPNYHEAVMREESDEHAENTVINELQKGYLIHDRLLRPSMVVVSAPKTNPAGDDEASPRQDH